MQAIQTGTKRYHKKIKIQKFHHIRSKNDFLYNIKGYVPSCIKKQGNKNVTYFFFYILHFCMKTFVVLGCPWSYGAVNIHVIVCLYVYVSEVLSQTSTGSTSSPILQISGRSQ